MKFKTGFLFAVILTMVLSVHAQEPVDSTLVHLTFDDDVPGMASKQIKRSWGKQNDDQLLIDNIKTVNDQGNALLFTRPEGIKNGGWGIGVNLPAKAYDWLRVELTYLLEGSATKATAGLEVREVYNKRLYMLGLGSSRGKDPVILTNGKDKWLSKGVNHFAREHWNRVTWYLPGPTVAENIMYCTLDQYDSKTNTWHVVGKTGDQQGSKVEKPFAIFRINFPGGAESMAFRFDDLKIDSLTNEKMSQLEK